MPSESVRKYIKESYDDLVGATLPLLYLEHACDLAEQVRRILEVYPALSDAYRSDVGFDGLSGAYRRWEELP